MEKNNIKKDNFCYLLKKILFVFIMCILFTGCTKIKETSNTQDLTDELNRLGKIFYEENYYDQIPGSKEEFLAQFANNGIEVDFETLIANIDIKEDIKSKFKNNKIKDCEEIPSTNIKIYPESPFGRGNYRIETHFACNKS